MSLGPGELVVIVLVIVLLFGAGRLAALGKGIGEGIREFKRGISGLADPNPKAEGDAKEKVTTAVDPSIPAKSPGATPSERIPNSSEEPSSRQSGV